MNKSSMKKEEKNNRILIFTNHFYPENFKVNDIAFYLSDKGKNVTVVTSIPNYPNREEYKSNYTLFKNRTEKVRGVNVVRIPLIYRGKGRKSDLIFTYISYLISSVIYAFYLGVSRRFDIVFVHHTSPIFIGIPSIIVKKLQGIKLYFWNLDLWPEAFTATTATSKGSIAVKVLLYITIQIQKRVDLMMVSSKGHIPFMLKRGVKKDNICYYPNWAEAFFFEEPQHELPFRMPKGFNIVFAGNMGEAQDLKNVIKAILELKQETHINWIFVGDGRAKTYIEKAIEEHDLSNNVFMPGRYPIEYMPAVYKSADVLLVSLVDEPIFTLPAKVQTYMASSKPILAMINGEGAELISKIGGGKSCLAGDYKTLAKNALELSYLDKEQLYQMGKNGYEYCIQNFHPDKCLDNLYRLITEIKE